jgi:hypothetical protein
MIKATGNRLVLQLNKKMIFEGKKPVLDDNGEQRYVLEQAAKVLSSNVYEIKKGMTVYPIIRGGVPIYHLENKKAQVVIIDFEDVYGVEI